VMRKYRFSKIKRKQTGLYEDDLHSLSSLLFF